MQMEVKMAIDMIEGQPRFAEFLELRVKFRSELLTQAWLVEIAKAGCCRAIGELPLRIDQPRNLVGGKRGMAEQQCQMKSNSQTRILASEVYGLFEAGLIGHQACTGEDPFAMSADDGMVD